MIYSTQPDNWLDLQEKAASILRVCGCESEVEKTVDTVRGQVAVDVLAVDVATTPQLTYLCECKHWNSAIPKSVVHSFRMVVSDYGAHVGFLISKSGFQSGAYDAAKNSNVRLVNWFEFQEIFVERWKLGRYNMLKQGFEDLFEYYDYLSAPIGNAIGGNAERAAEYRALLEKFSLQADANPWNRMMNPNRFPPPLPHVCNELDIHGVVTQLTFTDYTTLFDWHERRVQTGLQEFQNFVHQYRTGPAGT